MQLHRIVCSHEFLSLRSLQSTENPLRNHLNLFTRFYSACQIKDLSVRFAFASLTTAVILNLRSTTCLSLPSQSQHRCVASLPFTTSFFAPVEFSSKTPTSLILCSVPCSSQPPLSRHRHFTPTAVLRKSPRPISISRLKMLPLLHL